MTNPSGSHSGGWINWFPFRITYLHVNNSSQEKTKESKRITNAGNVSLSWASGPSSPGKNPKKAATHRPG